ncbi:MAG: hypothetical protein JXB42_06780 [Deltaproteobacteria bacterium]|nr:hypothetical protein [Deltaproteobacteria bacterium]
MACQLEFRLLSENAFLIIDIAGDLLHYESRNPCKSLELNSGTIPRHLSARDTQVGL